MPFWPEATPEQKAIIYALAQEVLNEDLVRL